MPVTIELIKQHLNTLGLEARLSKHDPNSVGVLITTENYVNTEGEKSLFVICEVTEDGQYLEVFSPVVVNLNTCRFKGAALAAMAEICLMTRYSQFEFHSASDTVRIAADMPVCDSVVTAAQLEALIGNLVTIMDRYQPVIQSAMETGTVDLTKRWEPEQQA